MFDTTTQAPAVHTTVSVEQLRQRLQTDLICAEVNDPATAFELAILAGARLADEEIKNGASVAWNIARRGDLRAAIDASFRGDPLDAVTEGALAVEAVEELLLEDRIFREREAEHEAREARTSWHPLDPAQFLDPDAPGDPPPAFLRRSDGVCLLYPDAVNAFYGESESMKSWVAQVAVAEVLRTGGCVAYLDFEASGRQVYGRLRQLGAPDEALRERFAYFRPEESLSTEARAELEGALSRLRPDLVVIDGVTDAMTLLGFDLNDNGDYARFNRLLADPIARSGASVLLVDHVTKSREGRGIYALGAQHKRAAVTGAAYTVHKRQEFGRGRVGVTELRVSKDRAGHVSAAATGGQRRIAEVTLTSHGTEDDAEITVLVAPPGGHADAPFRPTALMERLSRWIEENPDQTTNAIMEAVSGNRQAKGQALNTLIAERYVYAAASGRNSKSHASIRPYRQEADPESDEYAGND